MLDVAALVTSDDAAPTTSSFLPPRAKPAGKPTLLTRAEWRSKRKAADSFASRIARGPHLMVVGSEDELA